ncbi:MAG: hypothetical protein NVS3B10_20570 [Polyangiales bacterium]
MTEDPKAVDASEVRDAPSSPTVEPLGARRFPVTYDPPAETKRMALIFLACQVFSNVGLVLASRARSEQGSERTRDKLRAAAIALAGGLTTIGLISRRYRPRGGHAAQIVLELTEGEVRLWGGAYGSRIAYRDVARLRYRRVDTDLGRLGAMRQLRLGIEGAGRSIEVATEALVEDRARVLQPEGGEGDCVLLDRDDFEAFESALLTRVPKSVGESATRRSSS